MARHRPEGRHHGLSPLARGTRIVMIIGFSEFRFIPAGAGNTCWMNGKETSNTVYPRWRGEHHQQPFFYCRICGLSPLARGTHRADNLCLPQPRFIPAGAGNTTLFCGLLFPVPVYPRWRGEHCAAKNGKVSGIGLSPLARGTPN
ncbi:Domain of uncharacterised function (DUF2825) [Escherichia albertii]|nr:Domain of uncharacterised function (DUF2825) [Escherichia coli]